MLFRSRALDRQGHPNQALQLEDAAQALVQKAAERLGWSARATHRALKVARTIADLAGSETTTSAHVAEAMQYRRALIRATG